MKKLIYLLLLSLCFASCKKGEILTVSKDFGRINFYNLTGLSKPPYVVYEGQRVGNDLISIPYGSQRFTIFKASGELLLDTMLSISDSKRREYVIYQLDTLKKVQLLTERPPVDSNDPLKNEPAALAGYMKIKIANTGAMTVFPYAQIDMVINTFDENDVLTPIDTLHGVSATYNAEFFLVKRPLNPRTGELVTEYKFSYIDPVTGGMVKNSVDGVYRDPYPVFLNIQDRNNFLIELYEGDFTGDVDRRAKYIKIEDHYYDVEAIPMWQN